MIDDEANEIIPTARGTTTMAEIRTRVSVIEPGILRVVEVPDGSPESIRALGVVAKEVGSKFPRYAIVLDLTGVDAPNRAFRAAIVEWLVYLEAAHVAAIQAKSALARTAARFVMKRSGRPCSVHETEADALDMARAALTKR